MKERSEEQTETNKKPARSAEKRKKRGPRRDPFEEELFAMGEPDPPDPPPLAG